MTGRIHRQGYPRGGLDKTGFTEVPVDLTRVFLDMAKGSQRHPRCDWRIPDTHTKVIAQCFQRTGGSQDDKRIWGNRTRESQMGTEI